MGTVSEAKAMPVNKKLFCNKKEVQATVSNYNAAVIGGQKIMGRVTCNLFNDALFVTHYFFGKFVMERYF